MSDNKDKSNTTSHAQQESLNRFNNEFVDNLNTLKEKRKKLILKATEVNYLHDYPMCLKFCKIKVLKYGNCLELSHY